jgi:hypothetical protein
MANKLEAGHPMIVHCSDGWDRTSQLSSLSQLLLDPFYRTFAGFRVLVEKDWGSFGYMFAKRGGKGSEQSPVFLQWLDCVWQLWRQNEHQFEFNESFLVAIARLAYSDWFGTFLCDCEHERRELHITERFTSAWDYLLHPTRTRVRSFIVACASLDECDE